MKSAADKGKSAEVIGLGLRLLRSAMVAYPLTKSGLASFNLIRLAAMHPSSSVLTDFEFVVEVTDDMDEMLFNNAASRMRFRSIALLKAFRAREVLAA